RHRKKSRGIGAGLSHVATGLIFDFYRRTRNGGLALIEGGTAERRGELLPEGGRGQHRQAGDGGNRATPKQVRWRTDHGSPFRENAPDLAGLGGDNLGNGNILGLRGLR